MSIGRLVRWARGASVLLLPLLLVALPPLAGTAGAQDEVLTEEEELATELEDPVASLSSLPLRNTLDFGLGTTDAVRYRFNLVPNIAFRVLPTWDLVSRTDIPLFAQEALVPGGDGVSGLGDIEQTLLASPPADERPFDFGVGLVLLLPTATEDALGRDRWAIGPSATFDWQRYHWTLGISGNHQTSFAGSGVTDINTTTFSPFVARSWPSGLVINALVEPAYNWEVEQWTVLGFVSMSQVVDFGSMPVSLNGGVRLFLVGPDGGPDWGLRLAMTLLFPR